MQIALVSIAFNGYGRFVPQFLKFASEMSPKPNEVVIVLGANHGAPDKKKLKALYPTVKIVEYNGVPNFGKLRNISVKYTKSEWVQFVSVDDRPMPDAIETFERALEKDPDADYICSQWFTEGLGRSKSSHKSPTPYEYCHGQANGRKGGFIIAHSPFKRRLWELTPYITTDYPNAAFVLGCVRNNAKFVKSDKPTTTYLRRPDSHARTILIRKPEKKKAILQKRLMEKGFKEYYSRKGI
jgi:glycosyltransferase involved in cell wall biosynthesis